MNELFIQSLSIDWNRIEQHSYLRKIEAIKVSKGYRKAILMRELYITVSTKIQRVIRLQKCLLIIERFCLKDYF